MEKNSYERRAYESVDDGSPSWAVKICETLKFKFNLNFFFFNVNCRAV